MQFIQFDPDKKVGTTAQQPSGGTVRYVGPEEYFTRMLGSVMNATMVFLHAHSAVGLTPEQQRSVDDAIADAYWNKYLGCLMPPVVRQAISRAARGPSGEVLLAELEDARQSFFAAPSVEDATEVHASHRVQALVRGASGLYTDEQTSLCELMLDYLLLQRGIAEDVRRAEREQDSNHTRGDIIARLDRTADLHFEMVLGYIFNPRRAYQQIPKSRMRELEQFAQIRTPYHSTGILAVSV